MNWLPKRQTPLMVMSWSTVLVAGLLLLALAAIRSGVPSQGQLPDAVGDFGAAPAFALTDQLERPVSSEMFRGKVLIANFIYTSCNDICPLLSVQMQTLQNRLRQEQLLGSHVQLLSFTVDPVRDTPMVLRNYAERHNADPDAWRFLTGPEDTVKPLIMEGFRLGVQALPPATATRSLDDNGAATNTEYEVMHSGRFVLIDKQGRIRAYYDGREVDLERVVRDIRGLVG